MTAMSLDLEAVRRSLGVPTQARFAVLLGVSPVQYRRIISGASGTSASVMRLARAYLDGYRPEDWDAGDE